MRPPYNEEIEHLVARRTSSKKVRCGLNLRIEVGTHEPRPVLRQAERKSRGVPRLIVGACRRMAAHVERLPRLILKAGCRAGCKAGQAQLMQARRLAMAIVDFGWNVIYSPPVKP